MRTWLALWLFALTACACARNAPPPNLVIVTLDTTRADHLGLYGYFRDTSPNLDAFAEQAIVFERSIVPMATTLPTHVSFFTATHPLEHAVLYNTTFGAKPFVPTSRLQPLSEIARAAGWHTAAFVSGAPLKRGSGIEHGFEHFDQPTEPQRSATQTTDAALAWLEHESKGPFLLWVHYFDAHFPYAPPPPYATMFSSDAELEAVIAARRIPRTVFRPLVNATEQTRVSINLYDGELRYQDSQLGRLLSALAARPDWDHTLVVIAGDHGEGLGQHDEAAHGGIWDEQLHAPLLLRVPGEGPRRVATLVTAADVLPTVLGRLDVPALAPILAQASGRDVLAPDAVSRGVVSQSTGREDASKTRRYSLTTDRWKLVRSEPVGGPAQATLFDLRADPYELTDVSAQHADVAEQLSASLQLALAAQRRKGAELHVGEAPAATPQDPALQEQLRALGYVEGEPGPRP